MSSAGRSPHASAPAIRRRRNFCGDRGSGIIIRFVPKRRVQIRSVLARPRELLAM